MTNIQEILNKYKDEYNYVGIRFQEQEFELGELDHKSLVWIDGEETEEELEGVCIIDINQYNGQKYFGNHAAIICGDMGRMGVDEGEIIIADPVVVEVIAQEVQDNEKIP